MISRYGSTSPGLCSACASRNGLKRVPGECFICHGEIFDKQAGLIREALEKLSALEFSSFSISSRVPKKCEISEELLWDRFGIPNAVSLKTRLNSGLARQLKRKTGKTAEHNNPDVSVLLDFVSDSAEVSPNPIYIYGHYRKLSRELSQTKWPCYCKNGCDICKGTGVKHVSVEDLVSEPLLCSFQARASKFHGAGREDIDARMLGDGRPFVLELEAPMKRKLDLGKMQAELNELLEGKVELSRMRFTTRGAVETVKKARLEKSYCALVETSERISETKLSEIPSSLTLRQKTPKRVLHRRADLERVRKVKAISIELATPTTFRLCLSSEAGTYIKELISGDSGRTNPSISEFLGCDAVCKELDVCGIGHSFLSDYW